MTKQNTTFSRDHSENHRFSDGSIIDDNSGDIVVNRLGVLAWLDGGLIFRLRFLRDCVQLPFEFGRFLALAMTCSVPLCLVVVVKLERNF